MRLSREQARDFSEAHSEGLHDDLPREGCPDCEGRELRSYPTQAQLDEEAGRDAGLTSSELPMPLHPEEHQHPEECSMVFQGHVAAPGYGVAYECSTCGRPWLKIGSAWADPREQVYELSPEDVV